MSKQTFLMGKKTAVRMNVLKYEVLVSVHLPQISKKDATSRITLSISVHALTTFK